MKIIGLLSDTHNFLDERVFTHFKDCDEIWHAGDIGNIDVADRLKEFKPFRAVFGNIDGKDVRRQYPENLRFEMEGVDVWMTHIGGYPGRYSALIKKDLYKNPPKLFICGHSHILKVQYDPALKLLHLNPGAAGKQGWQTVSTLMRFKLDKGEIKDLEVIELGVE